jgi:hypothetical protein
MTNEERNFMRKYKDRWNFKNLYDDLYFAHEHESVNGGIKSVVFLFS